MWGGVGLHKPSQFFEILDVDPPATQENRGRYWYNTVDRQTKAIIDDGLGGFVMVIIG